MARHTSTDDLAAEALNDPRVRNAARAALKERQVQDQDIEDILQQAHVQAWRYGRTFDPAKATIETWILEIVKNVLKK